MNQQQLEDEIRALVDEEAEDKYYHPFPNSKILRSPNPISINDLRTGIHFLMVPGDYYPDNDTEFDDLVFYLLPNTTIDYKTTDSRRIIYHLELNSDKLDEFNHPVKKFDIVVLPPELTNCSKLDKIKIPFFSPNKIVPPRVPSR
jgi:hypothetical protein